MNEYLGGADGGTYFGAPGFTDVFESKQRTKYHDASLSPLGERQVSSLRLDVSLFDLVVVSPLQRALQTYDHGVHDVNAIVPVVAIPEAAERLYLVSDLGRPVAQLKADYPYVDFGTYFESATQ